uniref:hypothetical protein n=1 Tax=Microseira wollei TaxID=467598 RepID=UPI001CFDA044|nr:hypothetical protein [Microseira wollei]
MMEEAEIEPGLFRVEPLEGESLSHFLGRFRRANNLTPTGLGKMAGLAGAKRYRAASLTLVGKSFASILLLLVSSWRRWRWWWGWRAIA